MKLTDVNIEDLPPVHADLTLLSDQELRDLAERIIAWSKAYSLRIGAEVTGRKARDEWLTDHDWRVPEGWVTSSSPHLDQPDGDTS